MWIRIRMAASSVRRAWDWGFSFPSLPRMIPLLHSPSHGLAGVGLDIRAVGEAGQICFIAYIRAQVCSTEPVDHSCGFLAGDGSVWSEQFFRYALHDAVLVGPVYSLGVPGSFLHVGERIGAGDLGRASHPVEHRGHGGPGGIAVGIEGGGAGAPS